MISISPFDSKFSNLGFQVAPSQLPQTPAKSSHPKAHHPIAKAPPSSTRSPIPLSPANPAPTPPDLANPAGPGPNRSRICGMRSYFFGNAGIGISGSKILPHPPLGNCFRAEAREGFRIQSPFSSPSLCFAIALPSAKAQSEEGARSLGLSWGWGLRSWGGLAWVGLWFF